MSQLRGLNVTVSAPGESGIRHFPAHIIACFVFFPHACTVLGEVPLGNHFCVSHTPSTKIEGLKLFACHILANGGQVHQGDCVGPEGVCSGICEGAVMF